MFNDKSYCIIGTPHAHENYWNFKVKKLRLFIWILSCLLLTRCWARFVNKKGGRKAFWMPLLLFDSLSFDGSEPSKRIKIFPRPTSNLIETEITKHLFQLLKYISKAWFLYVTWLRCGRERKNSSGRRFFPKNGVCTYRIFSVPIP